MVYCETYINQEHSSMKIRYMQTNQTFCTTNDNKSIMKLRALQLLHGLWHKCYRCLMHTYSTAMIIGSISLAVYGVVKFQDMSVIKVAIISIQYWFHLYADHRLCGKLHETSHQFLEECLCLHSECMLGKHIF